MDNGPVSVSAQLAWNSAGQQVSRRRAEVTPRGLESLDTTDLCGTISNEYQQLLDDIHQCYLDQREALLSPSINSTITDLTSQSNKDHCALVRPLYPTSLL
ncbi:hypothetical protein SRHO_G00115480 [Serrasalmus rhombeus]